MTNSKAVDLIYMETQIHMLLGKEGDVMVNATDMAKIFDKRISNFIRLETTQNFIKKLLNEVENVDLKSKKELKLSDFEAENEYNVSDVRHYIPEKLKNHVIFTNKKGGTFMCKALALKFAAWLDIDFDIWIFKTIDKLLFSEYYQIHRERTAQIAETKIRIEKLKNDILNRVAGEDDAIELIREQDLLAKLQSEKRQAMDKQTKQIQYNLFGDV